MPTISVDKEDLFKALEREYTTKEFDELCFDFGIELDEDTSLGADGSLERPTLKIEIPANRYVEAVGDEFLHSLSDKTYPIYTLSESEYSLTVHKSTAQVREYGVAAVLRGIHFTQRSYDSFIGLQEKIHQNLGRQRTLVSIGTHDLDKTQGPYTYEALPPEDISFVPLNQTRKMNGRELVAFYDETDPRHIGRYLHIIRDAPVYPVMLDARRQVLSLPPIINSEYSKIDLRTRNIFIDITATDLTKMDIALNIITTMFAMHLDTPFTIEPVQVVSVHNNLTRITPNLQPRIFNVSVSYLNSCTGLDNSPDRITQYLKKMCLQAETTSKTDVLKVTVPVTRADVLHQCDVMEDYAVAYGFNSLPRAGPERAATTGQAFPLNKLTDIVRQEVALSGWTEVLPLILCSTEENFDLLRRKDDGSTAVRLANPKTFEYQVVRTTLLPGLLKTIRENKSHSLPLKIFEVSDIVVKDASKERASRNERRLAAIWTGLTSGFEIVQGLLDRVMVMLQIDALSVTNGTVGYWIEESNDPAYFKARGANIKYRASDQSPAQTIGNFGILHPEVVANFGIPVLCSALELNIEPFL